MEVTTANMLDRTSRQLETARACRRLIGIISQVGTVSPESLKPAIRRIDDDFDGAPPMVMAYARGVLTDALDVHPAHLTQEACHGVHRLLDVAVPTLRLALRELELMAQPMAPSDDDSDDQPPSPGSH